jgi:TIR domain
LHSAFEREGTRVWFAPENMKGGKKIYEQIESTIQSFDRLLLVLSPASMRSNWVATEVAHARQRESREQRQILFPIGLVDFDEIKRWQAFDADTGKDVGREVREYYIPDFSGWQDPVQFGEAVARLLRDLRATDGGATQRT